MSGKDWHQEKEPSTEIRWILEGQNTLEEKGQLTDHTWTQSIGIIQPGAQMIVRMNSTEEGGEKDTHDIMVVERKTNIQGSRNPVDIINIK